MLCDVHGALLCMVVWCSAVVCNSTSKFIINMIIVPIILNMYIHFFRKSLITEMNTTGVFYILSL